MRLRRALRLLTVLFAASGARAQTPGRLPHIGYLWLGPEGSDSATTLPGLQQGFRELGY
jgi:hypothetical protein